MELWIRSQDRESLLKVNNGLMYWEDTDKRHTIVIKETSTNLSIMGVYSTKERTLEILSEIHQRLLDLQVLEIAPDSYKVIKRNIDCVYEMPKE